jgi:transposase-like protein
MKDKEMICPHCGKNYLKKNGHYRTEQRYKCGECNKTFTLAKTDNRLKHPLILRKLALTLYLGGLSLRGIQRVLNISYSTNLYIRTILCWIKNSNNLLEQENQRRKEEIPRTGEKTIVPTAEMYELYTFVKKNREIKTENLTSINKYGLLWIGSEIKLLHLE